MGVVNNTSFGTSSILLPTDPDSKIPVKTAKTGAKGLLIGQFESGMLLDKVVQQDELLISDTVITSGEGGFADGIVIGSIANINKKETELFQTAEVKSLLGLSRLEYVFVETAL